MYEYLRYYFKSVNKKLITPVISATIVTRNVTEWSIVHSIKCIVLLDYNEIETDECMFCNVYYG